MLCLSNFDERISIKIGVFYYLMKTNSNKSGKIAVINYEAISLYKNQGWSIKRLEHYYNPNNVAKQVWIFARGDQDWEISPKVKVFGYQTFMDLQQKCKAFNPNVIRCFEAFRPNSDYALLIAMMLRVPSFLSLHDNRVQYSSHIPEFSVITGCSETIAARAENLLNREVETQLYPDIDPDVFTPREPVSIAPQVALAKFKIFTITRKDPVKNMETQIKATKLLSEKIGSVAHVIAGPGSDDIEYDGVHLGVGSLSQNMIADYMNWCDCFLQVQYIPEISHAPAEALTVGKPVIITGDQSGIAQKVIDDHRGILIPMAKVPDAEYIANALFECSRRKYNRRDIREWAVQRYGSELQEQLEAQRYEKLFSMKPNINYSKSIKLQLQFHLLKKQFMKYSLSTSN
jgi:glycosyltransferase involved in cell wall biosynthesis